MKIVTTFQRVVLNMQKLGNLKLGLIFHQWLSFQSILTETNYQSRKLRNHAGSKSTNARNEWKEFTSNGAT